MFTSHQNQRFREIAERVSDCRRKVRKYELMGRVEQDRDDLYDLLCQELGAAAELAEQVQRGRQADSGTE